MRYPHLSYDDFGKNNRSFTRKPFLCQNMEISLKDKSFKRRFVAFAVLTTVILPDKTSPNSAKKDAFADAKAMVVKMNLPSPFLKIKCTHILKNTGKKASCRPLTRVLSFILVFSMAFLFQISFLPPLKSGAEKTDKITEEDIDRLEQKIDELEKAKQRQEEELEKMKADQAKLQLALSSYSSLAKQYYNQIELVNANKETCAAALEEFKKQSSALEEDRKKLYENYKITLRTLRESRDISILELIFNAESLEDLLSAVERAKDLAEYKRHIMEKMEESFRKITEKEKSLEEELLTQTELGKNLEQMRLKVEKQIEDAENYLTAVAEEIMRAESTILELDETTEEIQKELTALIKAYEEQLEKERLARQSLLWPLDLYNKRCTSPYGYRYHPISGTYKFHTGVDLAGPTSGVIMGNSIYASMDGTVITSVVNRGKTGYGTYIIISHGYSERYGGNISTLYAHCEEIFVKKGDTVKQGDRIGRVGTTGASTGPHLHFEVRMNGVTTDPFSYTYITAINGEPTDPWSFVKKSY